MRYVVFRILTGRGLVDFLGALEAAGPGEAEALAAATFDCGEGERLEVTEEDADAS